LHDLKWSPSEKKIARSAFDAALDAALAKIMTEFKARANAAAAPSDMWEIEDFLRQQRREIDETFDYRYSQLPLLFARLIHEGRLDESRLIGGKAGDHPFVSCFCEETVSRARPSVELSIVFARSD
jgi:Photoprotection regulator fluorescence recovery protein